MIRERDENGHHLARYADGGFEPRFVIRRADGSPCRESARYFVLDGSGADPHAVLAIRVYAASVRCENTKLADQLLDMVNGDWPVELAQHENAK